jgi:hypothetical protein
MRCDALIVLVQSRRRILETRLPIRCDPCRDDSNGRNSASIGPLTVVEDGVHLHYRKPWLSGNTHLPAGAQNCVKVCLVCMELTRGSGLAPMPPLPDGRGSVPGQSHDREGMVV